MSCSACARHVEEAALSAEGVSSASVSLITGRLLVRFPDGSESPCAAVEAAVLRAGYRASAIHEGEPLPLLPQREGPRFRTPLFTLLFSLPAFYLTMGRMLALPLPPFLGAEGVRLIFVLLLTFPVLLLNRGILLRGLKTFRSLSFTMDSLVTLGVGVSLLYTLTLTVLHFALPETSLPSVHGAEEAPFMVLTFLSVGKALEGHAKDKTAASLSALSSLAPALAVRLKDGEEEAISPALLEKGDLLLLRTGEAAAADGEVVEGFGSMNESMLTGESLPVEKKPGDKVSTGCVLQSGRLVIRAEATGEETSLSAMLKTVTRAAADKAPISRLADRISGIFVPAVFFASFLTLILWLALGGGVSRAVSHAVSVLVVSCPCALGLATPTAIMAATGLSASRGILFKSGAALEALGKCRVIGLDKTGTLTLGRMSLAGLYPAEGVTPRRLMGMARALEASSLHPIAEAVRQAAKERECEEIAPPKEPVTLPGLGIAGRIGGRLSMAGNLAMLEEAELDASPLLPDYEAALMRGESAVFLASGGALLGLLTFSDTVREESPRAVAELKALGLRPIMLTGDHEKAAAHVAARVGICEISARLSPEGKAALISSHAQEGTVMVGDGINDALPLVSATVGIAIGAGTGVAIESADVILRRSSPEDIVTAVKISRRCYRIILENLFWALGYNLFFIPAAAGAFLFAGISLTAALSSLAMSLSSLLVVSNSLRLRRMK